jgi:hypothetical protein
VSAHRVVRSIERDDVELCKLIFIDHRVYRCHSLFTCS